MYIQYSSNNTGCRKCDEQQYTMEPLTGVIVGLLVHLC